MAVNDADIGIQLAVEGVGRFEQDMGRVDRATSRAAGNMTSAFSGLASALSVAAIGSMVADIGIKAVKSAIDYESLSTQFEVFLGSAEKAKTVLADLNKFSVETPFTPEEVNKAGRSLLAFGVATQQLIPTLKAVGDVSSAVGKDFNELAQIYGKAKTANQLFAEDINQLTGAGIPIIEELAKVLGVSADQVKKLGSQGKIHFDALDAAFKNMTAEGGRFSGMMDKMSQTTAGLISTIEGKLQDELRAIGLAMLPTIKTIVEGFEPAWASLKEAIVTIYTPMVDAFSAIGDLISVFNIGGTEGNKFANIVGTVASVLKVVTLPAQLFWKAIGFVVEQFKNFIDFSGRIIEKIGSIGSAFDLVLAPIKAVSAVWDELFGSVDEAAGLSEQSITRWNQAVDLMGKKTGATQLEMNKFIEQFDKSTIAGLSAADAAKVVTRQLLEFIKAGRGAGAANVPITIKATGDAFKYAAGSIGRMEEELKKLQEAYKSATADFSRSVISKEIEAIQFQLAKFTNEVDRLKSANILEAFGVSDDNTNTIGATVKEAEALHKALSDVTQLEIPQRTITDFLPTPDEIELQRNLWENFANTVSATFKELGQSVKETFLSIAGDTAFALGEVIAMGGNVGDVLKKAFVDLLIQLPKMAGMALLNAAAFPGNAPIALPLAAVGLGLLGASGIISGIAKASDKKKQDRFSAPDAATTSAVAGASQGQLGLTSFLSGDEMANAVRSGMNGAVFAFSPDGRNQFGGFIYTEVKKQEMKRGH